MISVKRDIEAGKRKLEQGITWMLVPFFPLIGGKRDLFQKDSVVILGSSSFL
jgi:hypothetical protein